jgi:hypothetical protein
MGGLLSAFFVEVALITYRTVTGGGTKQQVTAPLPYPLPSAYTSAIIVYGALGLLPRSFAPLPAMIGWGFVLATFLNLYNPAAANNAAASQAQLAQGLSSNPLSTKPT